MKSLKAFYNKKKVLVTGGTGFIGSHIVEALVKHGAIVTILDNLSTGNINNVKNVLPFISLIYGDITNKFTCFNATKNQQIVFHLAALVSVAYSTQYPDICHKINVEGTKNILEGCKKNNVETFVFSSSAAVYGNRNNKCKETDTPNPTSPYAESKLIGEQLSKKYANQYNINTIALRYFNVYGKRQNPNGNYAAVVAKFTHNLKNNIPLTIFGDGKQTRDFIQVSKIALANLNIATHKNLKGEIFNIASGKSINLFELITQLEKETNTKQVDLIFKAKRPGDILHSLANCDKYKLMQ
jgi:UDP-glucose 4-epimerase